MTGFPIPRTELQQVTSTPQVGVVSTARITHATPGAIYSHCPMRDWEADVNLPTDSVGCIDIATQVPSLWNFEYKQLVCLHS